MWTDTSSIRKIINTILNAGEEVKFSCTICCWKSWGYLRNNMLEQISECHYSGMASRVFHSRPYCNIFPWRLKPELPLPVLASDNRTHGTWSCRQLLCSMISLLFRWNVDTMWSKFEIVRQKTLQCILHVVEICRSSLKIGLRVFGDFPKAVVCCRAADWGSDDARALRLCEAHGGPQQGRADGWRAREQHGHPGSCHCWEESAQPGETKGEIMFSVREHSSSIDSGRETLVRCFWIGQFALGNSIFLSVEVICRRKRILTICLSTISGFLLHQ